LAAETGRMFAEEGIASAAAKYADAPMRQAQKNKDPRGWAEFAKMLSEHSAVGHAHTMMCLQLKRPTLWEMEAELKRFTAPLLVIVGDEDEPCLEGSLFLKRTAPTAALMVIPRTGHTVTSEEPAIFNAALAELFAAARQVVGARGLSTYVNRALRHQLRHDRLAGLLSELEREKGPIDQEVMAEVRQEWAAPKGRTAERHRA